jgi:hypothetical protein
MRLRNLRDDLVADDLKALLDSLKQVSKAASEAKLALQGLNVPSLAVPSAVGVPGQVGLGIGPQRKVLPEAGPRLPSKLNLPSSKSANVPAFFGANSSSLSSESLERVNTGLMAAQSITNSLQSGHWMGALAAGAGLLRGGRGVIGRTGLRFAGAYGLFQGGIEASEALRRGEPLGAAAQIVQGLQQNQIYKMMIDRERSSIMDKISLTGSSASAWKSQYGNIEFRFLKKWASYRGSFEPGLGPIDDAVNKAMDQVKGARVVKMRFGPGGGLSVAANTMSAIDDSERFLRLRQISVGAAGAAARGVAAGAGLLGRALQAIQAAPLTTMAGVWAGLEIYNVYQSIKEDRARRERERELNMDVIKLHRQYNLQVDANYLQRSEDLAIKQTIGKSWYLSSVSPRSSLGTIALKYLVDRGDVEGQKNEHFRILSMTIPKAVETQNRAMELAAAGNFTLANKIRIECKDWINKVDPENVGKYDYANIWRQTISNEDVYKNQKNAVSSNRLWHKLNNTREFTRTEVEGVDYK